MIAGVAGGITGCSSSSVDGSSPTARRDVAGEAVEVTDRCPPVAVESTAIATRRDVAFAVAGPDTLRLDVATPPARAGGAARPAVLLLHGGGWEGGHRRDMRGETETLAARGYVALTASYRLTTSPRRSFPAAVQDVRCAVRWIRANAASLGVDPGRIGALGFSAGAHLASLLGTGADVAALDRGSPDAPPEEWRCLSGMDEPTSVSAVVSVAGPQDLRVNGPYTAEQARLVTNFLGVFPGDAPTTAALASPIAHASSGDSPMLLVHGSRDGLVPIAHSRRMRDALRDAGVPATVLELPGVGHAFPAIDPARPSAAGCTVLAFLDRWLEPR